MAKRIIAYIGEHNDDNTFGDDLEGYVLKLTTGEELSIGIDSGQSCCEDYGYATTEDDLNSFIGAELLSYEVVNTELAVQHNKIADTDLFVIPELDSGDIVFLNVITDRGVLQFSVYNAHNGYYGHSAYVSFGEQKLYEDVL
jgi:hypothetical protein